MGRTKQAKKKSQRGEGHKSSTHERITKDDAQSSQRKVCTVSEGQSQEKGIGTGDKKVEEPEAMIDQRRYSRRKIVSNWERYEIPMEDEDENAAQLASETSKLKLELAGTSQSENRFSFHRESLWNSPENKQETISPFISVDCDKLAASLRSIPINERLCLSTHWFDPSTLEAIESQPSQLVPNEPIRQIQPLPKEYELGYLRQLFSGEQLETKQHENHQNSDNEWTLVSEIPQQQTITQQSLQTTITAPDCSQNTPTMQKTELDHTKQTNSRPTNCDKPSEQDDSIRIRQVPSLEAHVDDDITQTCNSNQTQELEDWLESVLD